MRSGLAGWALSVLIVWLGGCASAPSGDGVARFEAPSRQWVTDPAYYLQSVSGHLALLRASRPVAEWLDDPATPEGLRPRLALAQSIRTFATDVLHLPRNASYTRYADLQRRAVVWNVVAAPPHALALHTWCFPVAGCLGYKGFYDEAAARAFAARLPADWDVGVYPVPAYSTLGWTNWLGGDPLLNTFIHLPDGELARLIFHELAHQELYVAGDTAFSESFATAIERLGVDLWLAQAASSEARAAYQAYDARRQTFRALMRQTQARLQTLYAHADAERWPPDRIEADKARALEAFRQRYADLRTSWGGFAGYDLWAAQANNALFAVQAAYDEWVPAFEALFIAEDRDFRAFYRAVRELARLPRTEREDRLRFLASMRLREGYSSEPTNSM